MPTFILIVLLWLFNFAQAPYSCCLRGVIDIDMVWVRREHAHGDCKRAETEANFQRMTRRPKLAEGPAKAVHNILLCFRAATVL
jgi:hypothetical protein